MPPPLHITQDDVERIALHAARVHPEECCGILIGRRGDGAMLVERAVEAENIAEADRTRAYQVDWTTLLRTTKACRGGPSRIIGFYHSHPHGPLEPSARDHEHAWAEHAYLILSLTDGFLDTVTAWCAPPGTSRMEPQLVMIDR